MRQRGWTYWLFNVLGGLVLLFLLAPLLGMILHTSLPDLRQSLADAEVSRSIWLTLWVSFAGTVFFALGSIPLAYLMARRHFPLKGLVQGLIDIPVVLPHTAAGIALLGFISREGWLGSALEPLGINLVGTPAGIALAMAFVSLPFMVNAAREGFEAVPERLEKAALSLGASPARVFFSISLPLAWRSVVSGLVMMFARGMSEFGAVVIVAYHPMMAPVLIYERFGAFGLSYARPVAVLFMGVALLVFLLFRTVSHPPVKRKRHG